MTEFKQGDRVELVKTSDPCADLQPGARGVMLKDSPGPEDSFPISTPIGPVSNYEILSIKWDNGSWLQMIPEAGDEIKSLGPVASAKSDVNCPTCGNKKDNAAVDYNLKPEGGWWKCGADPKHIFEYRVSPKAVTV